MNKSLPKWLKYITIITMFFLYLPIIVLIIYSFNESSSSFHFTKFSFKWYQQLFADTKIQNAMKNTLLIGFLSSSISTFVGILGAYTLYKTKKIYHNTLMFTNNIPIINPDLITGVGLFMFFMFAGIKLGFSSLLLAHISFSIPYAILTIYPRLKSLSKYSIEAAYDLGASEFQTFYKVILPQLRTAIISAFLICFTLSIDDFIISFFTTGDNINNLSMLIYSIARRGVNPSINALSTIMFVIIFILLWIINKKTNLEQLEN